MRRADEAGLTSVVPGQGDARELPYGDATFDGAYLTAVLGEIPDQGVALRELARVVKPVGRLVVGELFGDPGGPDRPDASEDIAHRPGQIVSSLFGRD